MVTVALAVAGLLVGVALAARKQGAPRAWSVWALVLAAVALVAAAALGVSAR